jgi:predicted membrane protein (TIGR00267 family)
MLSDLRRSVQVKASSIASVWAALVDGFSPAVAAAVPMIPYALSFFGVAPSSWALPTSIVSILAILFIVGAFLGSISRENMVAAGLRMLAVGVATAVVLMVLSRLGTP